MAQIVENIYMKFVCKFKYDLPNSFQDIYPEKTTFFQ